MGRNSKSNRERKKERTRKRQIKRQEFSLNNNRLNLSKSFPVMNNPLEGFTIEQRKLFIEETGSFAKTEYESTLARIDDVTKSHDPLQLLSMLSYYFLSGGISEATGVDFKQKPFGINQFHAEFAQALILRRPDPSNIQPIRNQTFQQFSDDLKNLSLSLNFKNYDASILNEPEEKLAQKSLIKAIQGHTQIVRNGGFIGEVKGIAMELFSKLDLEYNASLGFKASDSILFFDHLMTSLEKRMTDHFSKLKLFMKSNKKEEVVANYYTKVLNQPFDQAEDFFKTDIFKRSSVDQLKYMMMSHRDLFLKDIYTFDTEELSKELGIELEAVQEIVKYFSISFDSLKEINVDHLVYNNPVWERPLISISPSQFFCSIPQVFFSFVLKTLTKAGEGFDEKVSKRRSDFLEEKIEEIVKSRFPDQKTHCSKKWKIGNDLFETDLLTCIDSCLLIIEAKSGAVTLPALRGAPDRIKRHLQEIIIAPSTQSQRLKDRVEKFQSSPENLALLSEELGVDLSKVNKIFRMSITLEDFAMIQSNINQHKKTGWLPEDYSPCPTMNLADFKVIFDLLEHPLLILHYLERRESIEQQCVYLGDEMDLLGHYIDTFLDSNYFPAEKDVILQLDGSSHKIDQYFNSLGYKVRLEKPKPQLSQVWSRLIERLEIRGFHRWTEIGLALLQVSPENQKIISKQMEHIKKNVRKNWQKAGHINTIFFSPPKGEDTSICFVFFCENNKTNRNNIVNDAVIEGLKTSESIKKCLAVAINIDAKDRPYDFVGIFQN